MGEEGPAPPRLAHVKHWRVEGQMTAETVGGGRYALIVFSAVGVAFLSGCRNTAEPSKRPYVGVISGCCGDIEAGRQVSNLGRVSL